MARVFHLPSLRKVLGVKVVVGVYQSTQKGAMIRPEKPADAT